MLSESVINPSTIEKLPMNRKNKEGGIGAYFKYIRMLWYLFFVKKLIESIGICF